MSLKLLMRHENCVYIYSIVWALFWMLKKKQQKKTTEQTRTTVPSAKESFNYISSATFTGALIEVAHILGTED